jgi:hypothetical protein
MTLVVVRVRGETLCIFSISSKAGMLELFDSKSCCLDDCFRASRAFTISIDSFRLNDLGNVLLTPLPEPLRVRADEEKRAKLLLIIVSFQSFDDIRK